MCSKKKILILDDEPHMRKLLEIALQDIYDIHTVENAKDALDTARVKKPDFAIFDMDIKDATTDGIATAHLMESENINIPVGFLCGYKLSELSECDKKRIAYVKNFRFYSQKPVSIKRIKEILYKELGEQKLSSK